MVAVFVNCGAVLLGSIAGVLFSKKITAEHSATITTASGIVTLVIAFQMAFAYESIIIVALALIIGGLVGTWLDIDSKILAIGAFLERRFLSTGQQQSTEQQQKSESGKNFPYAFLNASLLFCVGAMSIVGSIKAGIEKDYSIIFTKSVLDGFLAIVFAASLGIGTAFSAITIFVYQGFLTLAAIWVKPFVTEPLLNELTGVGGALIVMIGINLLDLKKIKTANYLPSLLLVILFVLGRDYVITLL